MAQYGRRPPSSPGRTTISPRLERCILHIKGDLRRTGIPGAGEAIALNAGYLVTDVMDIVENGISHSGAGRFGGLSYAGCAGNAPAALKDSGKPGEKAYTYRLSSSCTCLAGDVIGDYSFDHEIHVGDKLYFEDMAIYSMVKNNTSTAWPCLPLL